MLLLISSLLLMSCGADKYMKKGEKFLALGEYYDAAIVGTPRHDRG
jgi:hypothetical protein